MSWIIASLNVVNVPAPHVKVLNKNPLTPNEQENAPFFIKLNWLKKVYSSNWIEINTLRLWIISVDTVLGSAIPDPSAIILVSSG